MPTTQPALVAFHGQQAIKDEYLDRMEAHRAAGDLTRDPANGRDTSTDQEESREWHGNAIGCLVHEHTDPYGAVEEQLGVPRVLARLLNEFFRKMTPERHSNWPGQFLQAIPVGADLSRVWAQLAVWLLVAEPGVLRFARTASQRAAIQGVATLYQSVLAGEEVPRNAWLKAGEAARNVAVAGYPAAMRALFADADATPNLHGATYADAYATATNALNADLNLAYAFSTALAASTAVDTAYGLATHAAPDAAQDTVAAAAVAAVSGATYAAALTDAPVAVGAAAHYIAGLYAASCPRKDAYRSFVADASASYYDELASKLLALLAAAPVPAATANG